MLRLGHLTITELDGGSFRLDGGAMHGVVPKALWSKLVSCDELNRCAYATRCLLVDLDPTSATDHSIGAARLGRPVRRILIETGNGDKLSARDKDLFGIDHERSVVVALRELGVAPDSIDLVIMTHLHFDHSGGGTMRTASGALEPTFPRALYVVQRMELDDALHPHERNRASYLAENIGPVVERGQFLTVDGTAELAPGVFVEPTPGHTRGHQSVLLAPGGPLVASADSGGESALLFLGDVVPTAVHLRLPYIMAYDLDVVATLETKRRLIRRAIDGGWGVVWGHELGLGAARLRYDERGQAIVERPVVL